MDYERQFALGTVIAAGIAGGRAGGLPAGFDSPLTRLQSTLGELLGEHMQLVVDAMGAALRGGPEFRADAAQVNADTEQLASAFGVLFGPQSGGAVAERRRGKRAAAAARGLAARRRGQTVCRRPCSG